MTVGDVNVHKRRSIMITLSHILTGKWSDVLFRGHHSAH